MKAIFNLIIILLFSSGCASLLIAGAGGAVAYTITNVAYKTVGYPINKVESAARTTLKDMAIRELEKKNIENGVQIIARASDLKIYINIEEITPKTTKISVDAQKLTVIKDKATAYAIIEGTEKILESKVR
ncbi:MAG: DUF3568 family protein [Deltaproteobacteria bacterium]|nr:DUF3568 family protein [Deltaproteobacteria bacterium]